MWVSSKYYMIIFLTYYSYFMGGFMFKFRKLFREKVSLEKREKLKKVLKYKGSVHYTKPYLKGFLEGQNEKINNNAILLESLHGKSIDGHIFAIAKELNTRKIDTYVVTKYPEKLKVLLHSYGINKVNIIEHLSYDYGYLLATSKVLINDNTFYPFFSKRNDQKYYNFWHGTPLKTLGKHIEGEYIQFGNISRNFMMADSLFLSNEYTIDKLLKSLDLDDVLKSDVYLSPSPRNSNLFNKDRGNEIKQDLNLENKKVFIYMPTWRGSKNDKDIDFNESNVLTTLEQNLPDNIIVFYKLHSMVSNKFKFSGKKIKPFPKKYELYDFLSMVDGLITDYSSIMYDFASQNKKTILFTYDIEEYSKSRGLYEDPRNYPFEIVTNINSLMESIIDNADVDYTNFIKEYTPLDSIDGTKKVVDFLLNENENESIIKYPVYNNKPNVYMFAGPLWDTGITAALKNLLQNVNLENRNYIILFEKNALNSNSVENLKLLPSNVKIYPIEGIRILSSDEKALHTQYAIEGNSAGFSDKLKDIQYREISRIFGNNLPEYYIHYTGFEAKYSELVVFLKDLGTNTMIYVHTDMFEDYKNKKNYNKFLVSDAWQNANNLVLVNDNLKKGFYNHFSYNLKNIVVANNFLGLTRINDLMNENFMDTLLNVRFHFRTFDTTQSNLVKSLPLFFINQESIKDSVVQGAINQFNKLPLVKYANTKEKRQVLIENENILYLLYDLYIKNVYTNHIEDDFIDTVPDKIDRSKLILKLLTEDINNDYLLRNTDIVRDYINSYSYDSQTVNTNDNSDNLDLLSLQHFKNTFGLRKLQILKELEDPNIKVFFNIGRFDQQKGHDRLIKAFEKVYSEDENTRLYILSSYGPIKDKTLSQIHNSKAKNAITVLDRMTNPYLLLNKVDAFVLSSYYEGLGLVVYESMFVGTPVISVDLDTTTQFLNDTDFIKVENSENGIFIGMKNFLLGERPTTRFNLEKYEYDRIQEFENLF